MKQRIGKQQLLELIDSEATQAVKTLREKFVFPDGSPEDQAMCYLECLFWVSLKVLKHAREYHIREYSLMLETKARLDGLPVYEDGAFRMPEPDAKPTAIAALMLVEGVEA